MPSHPSTRRSRDARWGAVVLVVVIAAVSACSSRGEASSTKEDVFVVGPDGRAPVRVDGEGYHPSTVRAEKAKPVTLVFTRTTDESCGQEVVFPKLNIKRSLPLNTPVEVAIPAGHGDVTFTCGMNMYRGKIVGR